MTTDELLAFVDKCRDSGLNRYDLAIELAQLCGRVALEAINEILERELKEALRGNPGPDTPVGIRS